MFTKKKLLGHTNIEEKKKLRKIESFAELEMLLLIEKDLCHEAVFRINQQSDDKSYRCLIDLIFANDANNSVIGKKTIIGQEMCDVR